MRGSEYKGRGVGEGRGKTGEGREERRNILDVIVDIYFELVDKSFQEMSESARPRCTEERYLSI